ncbi:hypothetical protein GQ457_01G027510 [Hibiscus cannabinus]
MSSASASIFSSKVLMESSCRFQPAIIRFISRHKAKRHQIIRNRNLQLLGASLRLRTTDRDKNMVVCCSVGSGPSIPSNPGAWKLWVLGILLSIALPFWRSKSGPLLKLKDEVETVIDKVEAVTDYAEKLAEQVEEVTGVAEKVSEEMEKVADEIGNHLPEGRLKDALEIVEHTAQNTAEGARFTGEFINKVLSFLHCMQYT